MPNEYLDKITLNNTTYDIIDTASGYINDVKVNGTSIVSSGEANLVTNTAYDAVSNKLATMSDVGSAGGGTVTSVGIQNGGGLTISGSPITSSGNITVGHSNSVTAQTTQAVYPIAIDAQGHISSYGTAVDIPTPETFLVNATITTVSAGGVPTGGTTDKSAAEIYTAASNGMLPIIKVSMQSIGTVFLLASLSLTENPTSSTTYARFIYEDQSNPTFQYATVQVIGNNFTIEFAPPYLKSGGWDRGGMSIENQDGTLVLTNPDFVNNNIMAIDHQYLGTGKTTQAVYPITIDDFGHIESAGSAVTIPTQVTESTVSGWGFTKNTGTVTGVTAGTGLTGGTISASGTIALDTTRAITASDISTGTDTTNKLVSAKVIADAIAGAGGGDVFWVTLSYDDMEEEWSIDCSYSDISTAYTAGKAIYMKLSDYTPFYLQDAVGQLVSFHWPEIDEHTQEYVDGPFVFQFYQANTIAIIVEVWPGYIMVESMGVTTVRANRLASTTGAYYAPLLRDSTLSPNGTSDTTIDYSDSMRFKFSKGTTSTPGVSALFLGNGTNAGTNGNQYGYVAMYPQNGNYLAYILPTTTLTASRTLYLPDKSGTLATTDDITAAINALDASNTSY